MSAPAKPSEIAARQRQQRQQQQQGRQQPAAVQPSVPSQFLKDLTPKVSGLS